MWQQAENAENPQHQDECCHGLEDAPHDRIHRDETDEVEEESEDDERYENGNHDASASMAAFLAEHLALMFSLMLSGTRSSP